MEDLVLFVLLAAWLALRPRLQPVLRGVTLAFAIYLLVALLSTATNVLLHGLSPARGAVYWGKQVEYFSIFLLAASWARTAAERRWLLLVFLGLGILNGLWVGYQVACHTRRSLFQVMPAFNTYQSPNLFDSYGPGLIGEVSPLSTGSFFLAQFLLIFTLFVLGANRGWRPQLGRLTGAALMLCPVFLSQSRVSIGGSLVGAATIAVASRRFRRAGLAYGIAAAISIAVLASTGSPSIKRLVLWHNIVNSFTFRAGQIWAPQVGVMPEPTATATPRRSPSASASPPPIGTSQATGAAPTVAIPPRCSQNSRAQLVAFVSESNAEFVIGRGSGAMGDIGSDLPTESSNYYLRSFIETGALGLLAFLWLLSAAVLLLVRAYRSRIRDPGDRPIVLGALALLIGFCAAALLQDVFLPVVPNEVLWFLVGLAGAAATHRPRASRAVPESPPAD